MEDGFRLQSLVRELTALPKETEWVEFKLNVAVPDKIGEIVSALSNSAAIQGKPEAYLVWGVEDDSRRIVGTTFRPRQARIGNEELENWLLTQLDPPIAVQIREGEVDGNTVVLFEIQPATNRPVRFRGTEYVRIGSYTKRLHDHPEKERELWRVFDRRPFEVGIAREHVTSDDVLALINYPEFFRLMNQPLPFDKAAILRKLTSERIIEAAGSDRFNITNMGAVLFGSNLGMFDRLARKALRVIIYRGENRVETLRE